MAIRIFSACVVGLDGLPVTVEVDTSRQLPGITIVGLPDKAVDEAKVRVRAAVKNAGFEVPRQHVVVNLAPADIKKEGPGFDLAMAVGLLMATKQICPVIDIATAIMVGEVGLDGSLRPVRGVLPMAMAVASAGFKMMVVSRSNADQAAMIPGIAVYGFGQLSELVEWLCGLRSMSPWVPSAVENNDLAPMVDMAEVYGHFQVKRALEIAAAGRHNILFTGPPGTGKSLLAKALPGILPPLTTTEYIDVCCIASAATGSVPTHRQRPWRSPHHSASAAALIGGGSIPRPGEITMAHNGVLFLDEFAEFPRVVLDHLRQPLEEGKVTVNRVAHSYQFPARFILVAAMNPCPCGYYGDPDHACCCTPFIIQRYHKKISGPLIDRIDLHVPVLRQPVHQLQQTEQPESSSVVRARIVQAMTRQEQRQGAVVNSQLTPKQLAHYNLLTPEARQLLDQAAQQWQVSARVYFRLMKVATTIADLAGTDQVTVEYMAEALQYRPMNQGRLGV